ncbi:MAG: DUF2807 domain-containing protein [Bacteroidia bacterium]|nr:DUF2807 domain-containing protein [Bacteroidia bacterium]
MKRFILIFLFGIFIPLMAFSQINGNGQIITTTRSAGVFTGIVIDFPAEVEIICQTIPHLEITTDKNILPYIQVETEGATLKILQGKWIEPTQTVRIKIGTAFLHKLETGGYGEYWVRNIQSPVFKLHNPVGTVELEGTTDYLEVSINTGKVDASQLVARHVKAEIHSFGQAKVHALDMLEAEVAVNGKLIYLEKPEQIKGTGPIVSLSQVEDEPAVEVKYIKLILMNNSLSKVDLYIQGPPHRRFSYGIPLGAGQRRKEELPVGTRIYLDQVITRKLLATIEEKDENQLVKLFEK